MYTVKQLTKLAKKGPFNINTTTAKEYTRVWKRVDILARSYPLLLDHISINGINVATIGEAQIEADNLGRKLNKKLTRVAHKKSTEEGTTFNIRLTVKGVVLNTDAAKAEFVKKYEAWADDEKNDACGMCDSIAEIFPKDLFNFLETIADEYTNIKTEVVE